MKSAKKWLMGWKPFISKRHKGWAAVNVDDVQEAQLEYIRMIQKDARKSTVNRVRNRKSSY